MTCLLCWCSQIFGNTEALEHWSMWVKELVVSPLMSERILCVVWSHMQPWGCGQRGRTGISKSHECSSPAMKGATYLLRRMGKEPARECGLQWNPCKLFTLIQAQACSIRVGRSNSITSSEFCPTNGTRSPMCCSVLCCKEGVGWDCCTGTWLTS